MLLAGEEIFWGYKDHAIGLHRDLEQPAQAKAAFRPVFETEIFWKNLDSF